MWRVIKTSDGSNIGQELLGAEVGQIITFQNGLVVPVKETYLNPTETQLMIVSDHYQMTLSRIEN